MFAVIFYFAIFSPFIFLLLYDLLYKSKFVKLIQGFTITWAKNRLGSFFLSLCQKDTSNGYNGYRRELDYENGIYDDSDYRHGANKIVTFVTYIVAVILTLATMTFATSMAEVGGSITSSIFVVPFLLLVEKFIVSICDEFRVTSMTDKW